MIAGVALLIGLWWPSALAATADEPVATALPNEYTVKAVFLYSFGRYVQWPAGAFSGGEDPFVIGVLGDDLIVGSLQEIAAKRTIQDRRIVVRRFASLDAYREPCHILFVSRSVSEEERHALIARTESRPVLVVGEIPGFAEDGATANFFADDNRVQFELNVDAARRAQLRMEAPLLRLGKRVGLERPTASR